MKHRITLTIESSEPTDIISLSKYTTELLSSHIFSVELNSIEEITPDREKLERIIKFCDEISAKVSKLTEVELRDLDRQYRELQHQNNQRA